MGSRRQSRGKRINPTYFVFCEGETEEEYVKYLRSVFRIPIEINSKKTGDSISKRFINNYLKTKTRHPKDEIFLMFDLDVEGTLQKLDQLGGIILGSNPCLELWFVLHHRDQEANISSSNCIRALKEIWPNYEKGKLTESQKGELIDNINEAKARAQQLTCHDNPSTSVDVLIEYIEEALENKK